MPRDVSSALAPLLMNWLDGDAGALPALLRCAEAATTPRLQADYHGIPLCFAANHEAFVRQVQEHFGAFGRLEAGQPPSFMHLHLPAPLVPDAFFGRRDQGDLEVRFPAFGPEARLQTILLEDGWLLVEEPGTLLITSQAEARVLLVTVEGRNLASGVFRTRQTSPSFRSRLSGDALLLTVLQELTACFGATLLHAACVERDGRGVLIMAPESRGKSTTTFSLVRAGWRMLSDDRTLLRRPDAALTLHSFPERSRLGGRSVAFFPELAGKVALPGGEGKAEFDPEAVWGEVRSDAAAPALLVIPEVSDRALPFARRVQPLSGFGAVSELMADNLLRTAPEATRQRFELLTSLFAAIPMVRLQVGPGVERTADHLERLLGEVVG